VIANGCRCPSLKTASEQKLAFLFFSWRKIAITLIDIS